MKKKVILISIIAILLFVTSPVLAENISSCSNALPGVIIDKRIPDLVHTIIVAIKIIVPILLIIFGMLDLMKGITAQKEDEIKKGQQIFIKRLIAGALVFFIFTIVQLLISAVSPKGTIEEKKADTNMWNCVNCFINGKCD